MKNIAILLLVTILNIKCTKNQNTNSILEQKVDLIKKVDVVSSQLGIQLDSRKFKEIVKEKTTLLMLSKALNLRKSKYQSLSVENLLETGDLDTANSVTYHFVLEDGFELESVIIPYSTNTSEFYNYINSDNEEIGLELISRIDPESETLILRVAGKYGGWWGCMKNFFGSDVGTVVNILGVASSVGCVPCAIVAAFTTGIMAIACIHG